MLVLSIGLITPIILQAMGRSSITARRPLTMNAYIDDDRLKNLSICVIMRQFFIQKWCDISAKIQFQAITIV